MDWIKRGWGRNLSPDFSPVERFHLDVTRLAVHHKPLLEVSGRVINEIANTHPAPFVLMASGGVDTQSMIWCWHNSGVPFNIVSVRLVDHDGTVLNDEDTCTLQPFLDQLGLKVTYLTFNIFDFLENRLLDYATKYQCTSPQITAHMAMSEMIPEGTKVFGGNFLSGDRYTYTIWGLDRYAQLSDNSIIPFFLSYDPELSSTLFQYMGEKNPDQSYYEQKVDLLRKAGIPVVPQDKKRTGFEKIKDICDVRYGHLVTVRDRLKYHNQLSKRTFDILFRYRLSDKIRYDDNLEYILPDWLNPRPPTATGV